MDTMYSVLRASYDPFLAAILREKKRKEERKREKGRKKKKKKKKKKTELNWNDPAEWPGPCFPLAGSLHYRINRAPYKFGLKSGDELRVGMLHLKVEGFQRHRSIILHTPALSTILHVSCIVSIRDK